MALDAPGGGVRGADRPPLGAGDNPNFSLCSALAPLLDVAEAEHDHEINTRKCHVFKFWDVKATSLSIAEADLLSNQGHLYPWSSLPSKALRTFPQDHLKASPPELKCINN